MSDYNYELMLDRLQKAMNEQKLTIKKLAQLATVPYGTLYKVLSGETKDPSINMIIRVAGILNVTADYLIYGNNSKPNNEHILKKYNALDIHGKEIVDTIINYEYGRCINIEDKNTPSTIIKIPLADLSLSAGQGNFFLDASYDMIQVDGKKYPKADIAFRITGDSMEPRYFDGDIVYIHKQDVNVGEIGAFLYNNNQYLKKLIQKKGIYYLHSLNPNYDDIEINNDSLITYGKVLN